MQGPVRKAVGVAKALDESCFLGGLGPQAMIHGHDMDGGVGQMRPGHRGKMQECGGVRAARDSQNQPCRFRRMACGGKKRRGFAGADRAIVLQLQRDDCSSVCSLRRTLSLICG